MPVVERSGAYDDRRATSTQPRHGGSDWSSAGNRARIGPRFPDQRRRGTVNSSRSTDLPIW